MAGVSIEPVGHGREACPWCEQARELCGFGVCVPCLTAFIAEHPERQLLANGGSMRFVVPAPRPARREPKPHALDEVLDPWALAEFRGDADPDDVACWDRALAEFHGDERGPLMDAAGHLFGPIELISERVIERAPCWLR